MSNASSSTGKQAAAGIRDRLYRISRAAHHAPGGSPPRVVSADTEKRMEPWGVEPQSRCSQHAASTRVSDGLILTSATAIGSLRACPARGVMSRVMPRASITRQPDVYATPLSGVLGCACGLIRPRGDNRCCWQLLFLHAFYVASVRHDAPRRAFPARSNPVRPQLSKNRGSYARRWARVRPWVPRGLGWPVLALCVRPLGWLMGRARGAARGASSRGLGGLLSRARRGAQAVEAHRHDGLVVVARGRAAVRIERAVD